MTKQITGPIGVTMYLYTMFVFTSMILFIAEADTYIPLIAKDMFLQPRINGIGSTDSTPPSGHDKVSAILYNIALLSPFMIQHCVMARQWFKDGITTFLPVALERGLYCVGAGGSLHYAMVNWIPIPDVLVAVPDYLYGAIMCVHAIGWVVLLASTFMIDHFDLFGLRQAFTSDEKDIVPQFVLTGFYHFVRHPIMTGFLMAFWFHPVFTVGRLLLSTVFTFFIYFMVFVYEEPGLVDMFGDEYVNYKKIVPPFCPHFGMGVTARPSKKTD